MDPKTKRELLKRVRLDQKMRNLYLKSGILDESADKDNTEFMKYVVDKYGWPRISDVGQEVADGAWLLVQHADHDLEFQKKCLNLMQKLTKNEVNYQNIAYLTDRILVAEGKDQLYGTQFYNNRNKLVPRKIKDRTNLNKRRKAMGLSTFEEYEKIMEETYQ